mmetsp:Transcript_51361/g.109281  ORF Transcript_51361/g.109281 Transcript_51361/m.109281 type:complete len:84 (+) Transcript_51361:124-375(+)
MVESTDVISSKLKEPVHSITYTSAPTQTPTCVAANLVLVIIYVNVFVVLNRSVILLTLLILLIALVTLLDPALSSSSAMCPPP